MAGSRTHLTLSTRELDLLRFLAEQGAGPVDQLAEFLSCEEGECLALLNRLSGAGYLEVEKVLVDEPAWAWLWGKGARASGTGFAARQLKPGALKRIRAVNGVRLLLARHAPDGRWVCGRGLRKEQGVEGTKPSAVFEVGEERHAIVVKQGRVRSAAYEWELACVYMNRYDAVVYFVDNVFRRCLERESAGGEWPKLFVRELPRSSRLGEKLR